MFPIYPGFEGLTLHVEVEWREQTRTVIARLEQWPELGIAVLVCAFEDAPDDGEWIVIGKHGLIPYQMSNPYNLVTETKTYQVKTRSPLLQWKRPNQRKEKLQQIVCKAFGNHKDYSIGRLLKLDDLPSEPRVALRTLCKSVWMPTYSHESWIEFEGQAQSDLTELQEKLRLMMEWQNKESEAHFAWEWAKLDDEQRKHHLGFTGNLQELERILNLGLAARNHNWKEDDWLMWQFDVNQETGQLYGSFDNAAPNNQQANLNLSLWDEFLLTRYAPNWCAELVVQHECVKQYIGSKYYEFGYAIRNQAPTAHEQLEAKLALRDWLRDAATPAVAAALLASLDA